MFTVYQSGTTNAAPFGSIDTPLDGSSASGSIAVTGWALDDLGVVGVTIYRDPVGNEPAGAPVFIGGATLVTGARPDVEAASSTLPFANRAGWGYLLLTNMLPNQGNGTFRLLAYAVDGDRHERFAGYADDRATTRARRSRSAQSTRPRRGRPASGRATSTSAGR